MQDWATSVFESLGYLGVVLLMCVENLFPPIPSELVMPLAGYAAARGELWLTGVVLAGTAGSVLGALPLYYLGWAIGEERLKRWCARHGYWLAVGPDDVDRAGRWFDRHCRWAVLVGRLVPGVRSLISIPAGVHGMNLVPFLLYTAVGTALWSSLLGGLGYVLGENHAVVGRFLSPLAWGVCAVIVVGLVVRAVRLRRQAGRDARA